MKISRTVFKEQGEKREVRSEKREARREMREEIREKRVERKEKREARSEKREEEKRPFCTGLSSGNQVDGLPLGLRCELLFFRNFV